MKIKLLFFGATADSVGLRRTEWPITEHNTAELVVDQVVSKFPQLKNHNLIFALNESYLSPNAVLRDGDELAVFTPVSGG